MPSIVKIFKKNAALLFVCIWETRVLDLSLQFDVIFSASSKQHMADSTQTVLVLTFLAGLFICPSTLPLQ